MIGKEGGDPLAAIANAEAAVKASPDDFIPLCDNYLSRHPDDGPAHIERGYAVPLGS